MVGPPKKHLLPLLFLLSIVLLFFLTHYHSTSSIPTPNSTLTQTLNSQITPSTFTFLIKLLAFNRLDSVSRCLRSLAAADYGGDTVHLHVYIDHFVNDPTADLDIKLEESRRVLKFVDGFNWEFGEKVIHYRTVNVGLQGQWLEAWWPRSNDEFAFVVEDDLEVSRVYYKFVKGLISRYYYDPSNFDPSVFGVSLQRARFVPGKHGNKIQLDSGAPLFLYQLVGTWGQILFPRPWKEFRLWYDQHKSKGIKPYLDGMVTTGWYKRMGEKIWTPWFIKFIHAKGYFNIYTNFEQERALSVSHRDAGVSNKKTAGPDSLLMDETSLDFNSLKMPLLSSLKWYDFCFREILRGRVIRSFYELRLVLPSVQKQQSVVLVSIFGIPDVITRNLLCHFERLNIGNYILLGPHSDFLVDLARRGHPVINADQLLQNMGMQKLVQSQESSKFWVKESLVKAHIIKKCLEEGYSSWTVGANLLFLETDMFQKLKPSSDDFCAAKHLDLLFVKSSSSSKKIWSDSFLNRLAATVAQVSSSESSRNFVSTVENLLEQSSVKVHEVDEVSFGTKLGTNIDQSTSVSGKELVFWPMQMDFDAIHNHLEKLSLWIVDGDSSCVAVVCHQS